LKRIAARVFPPLKNGSQVKKQLAARSLTRMVECNRIISRERKQVTVKGFIKPAACKNGVSDIKEAAAGGFHPRADGIEIIGQDDTAIPQEAKEQRTAKEGKHI